MGFQGGITAPTGWLVLLCGFFAKFGAAQTSQVVAQLVRTHREQVELGLRLGRNAMAIWQDLVSDHGFAGGYLMRDINPHLAFSVRFLTSPKEHPLYARPWKQWRLARGKEERQGVDK